MAKQIRDQNDLGLGYRVIQEQKRRFLNRDGTFNIYRKSAFGRGRFSLYHAILRMSWPAFYAWILGLFILANAIFATIYLALGTEAFPELANFSRIQRFEQLFLYSIQILTTLGTSPIFPATLGGQAFLDIASTLGLLAFALATGLIFARFSNPRTKIIFSDRAVIAPYNDITAFMLRIINGRNNELINVTATVTLVMIDREGKRQFQQLPLERDTVLVFPLNWTIVHPIDQTSPIYGMTAGQLERSGAEFLISISAIDKDLSKQVFSRFSYQNREIVTGAKFVSMLEQTEDGRVIANPGLIHDYTKVDLPQKMSPKEITDEKF